MCYYIGIEDLAANALIELVDKTGSREVSFKTLNEYGTIVVKTLRSSNQEAFLLLSRDRTNEFIHNCTEYFSITNKTNGASLICLKEGITTNQLRAQFRTNISLNVLLAFVNKQSLAVLGAG